MRAGRIPTLVSRPWALGILGLLAAAVAPVGPVAAQEASSDEEAVARRIRSLVEELPDASDRRREVIRSEIQVLGADGLPVLADLLVDLPPDDPSRGPVRDLVATGTRQLARGLWDAEADAAEGIAEDLRAIGPAAAREIWTSGLGLPSEAEVPAGRIVPGRSGADLARVVAPFEESPELPFLESPPGAERAAELLDAMAADVRIGDGGDGGSIPAEHLESLGSLAAPVVDRLASSEEPRRRAVGERIAARVAERNVRDLASPDPAVRERARRILYRWGELAIPALERAAEGDDPTARYLANRLLRRIRRAISSPLYERTGHLLEGFDEADWRERRRTCLRLRTLGTLEAVPTLRVIAVTDPSRGVREGALRALAQLGDPFGVIGVRVLEIETVSPVDAYIFMDQGLRYLEEGEYDRALREFRRVLEIEPGSSIALYNLACTHSLMGEIEAALDHLERSVEAGFTDWEHMEEDGDLDPIRDTDRYRAVIRRLREDDEAGGDR